MELEAHTFDLHHNEEMMVGNVMTEYEEKIFFYRKSYLQDDHSSLNVSRCCISFHIIRKKYLAGVFYMKRTRSLQKFAAQFGYEHKNRSNPFSSIKKHANELSKLLDSMFPKDKNDKEKS